MTAHKLLEDALERIDRLSDAAFSALTAEIIAESSVAQDSSVVCTLHLPQNYDRKLHAAPYICSSEIVAANDNIAQAA